MKYLLIFNLFFCLQLAPSKVSEPHLPYQVTKLNCDLNSCALTLKRLQQNYFVTLKTKDVFFRVGDTLHVNSLVYKNKKLKTLKSFKVRNPLKRISYKIVAATNIRPQAQSHIDQHHPSADYRLF